MQHVIVSVSSRNTDLLFAHGDFYYPLAIQLFSTSGHAGQYCCASSTRRFPKTSLQWTN